MKYISDNKHEFDIKVIFEYNYIDENKTIIDDNFIHAILYINGIKNKELFDIFNDDNNKLYYRAALDDYAMYIIDNKIDISKRHINNARLCSYPVEYKLF